MRELGNMHFSAFPRELGNAISSLLHGSFAKEAYGFKEPPNRSHPIRNSDGVDVLYEMQSSRVLFW